MLVYLFIMLARQSLFKSGSVRCQRRHAEYSDSQNERWIDMWHFYGQGKSAEGLFFTKFSLNCAFELKLAHLGGKLLTS